MIQHIEFINAELLPPAWRREPDATNFFVWNPTILPRGDGYLMAYRVTSPDLTSRRVAACLLDARFNLLPDSVTALSDSITGPATAFSDPRLLAYRDHVYLNFQSIDHLQTPILVELDPDTLAARSAARPLLLDGPRKAIEKNWMLFEQDGDLLAVYTLAPHVVLQVELNRGPEIHCLPAWQVDWDASAYTTRYSEPRGGTPPVRVGDTYYSFFHSSYASGIVHQSLRPFWRRLQMLFGSAHTGSDQHAETFAEKVQLSGRAASLSRLHRLYFRIFARRRYVCGFYGFSTRPPFTPQRLAPAPVLTPEAMGSRQRRNPANPSVGPVIFPGGAVFLQDGRWAVAAGVHDERCSLCILDHQWLMQQTVPVDSQVRFQVLEPGDCIHADTIPG